MEPRSWRGSFCAVMWVCVVSSRAARGGKTTQDRITRTTGLGSVRRSNDSWRVAGCGVARGSRLIVGRAGAALDTFDNPRRFP